MCRYILSLKSLYDCKTLFIQLKNCFAYRNNLNKTTIDLYFKYDSSVNYSYSI